jgi:hypothetical protein
VTSIHEELRPITAPSVAAATAAAGVSGSPRSFGDRSQRSLASGGSGLPPYMSGARPVGTPGAGSARDRAAAAMAAARQTMLAVRPQTVRGRRAWLLGAWRVLIREADRRRRCAADPVCAAVRLGAAGPRTVAVVAQSERQWRRMAVTRRADDEIDRLCEERKKE